MVEARSERADVGGEEEGEEKRGWGGGGVNWGKVAWAGTLLSLN